MLHLTVTCLNVTFLLFHERLEISRKTFYPNKLRDFHARCVISYNDRIPSRPLNNCIFIGMSGIPAELFVVVCSHDCR